MNNIIDELRKIPGYRENENMSGVRLRFNISHESIEISFNKDKEKPSIEEICRFLYKNLLIYNERRPNFKFKLKENGD